MAHDNKRERELARRREHEANVAASNRATAQRQAELARWKGGRRR